MNRACELQTNETLLMNVLNGGVVHQHNYMEVT